MERKAIMWLLVLVALFPIATAFQCEHVIKPDTNCTMTTPVTACSVYNYTIYHENGSVVDTGSMSALGGGMYEFTFNQPEGSYNVISCDNRSREAFVRESSIDMIIIFIFFAWVLLALAFWQESPWLGISAGFMLGILGVFAVIYGIGGINDWVTRSVGWVHIGIGLLALFVAAYEQAFK